MTRLQGIALAVASVLSLAASLPAAAEEREPISPQGQIQDQRQPADQLDLGTCPSPTQITNSQGGCTPCLDNSVAGRGNAICVCNSGFTEVDRDTWGRATCIVASLAADPAPAIVEVTAPAGEVFRYSEQVGFGANVTHAAGGPLTLCGAWNERGQLYAEYNAGTLIVPVAPPAIMDDEREISCDIVLMGAQLNNGWELVSLQNIDSSECVGELKGYGLTRRSSNPADTTHDLRLTSFDRNLLGPGFCIIRIHDAVMRGPADGKWEDAFGG